MSAGIIALADLHANGIETCADNEHYRHIFEVELGVVEKCLRRSTLVGLPEQRCCLTGADRQTQSDIVDQNQMH